MTGIKGVDVDYVFCLPGNPSSGKQALNVNVSMFDLAVSGKRVGLKYAKSCNIYTARNGCLADNGNRRGQKPFEGVYNNYDRMIWIDSDNIISAEKINQLIAHDVDIVAAWYRQYVDGSITEKNKVACGRWDLSEGKNVIESFTYEDMPYLKRDEKGLVEVDFAGMGLMVVKKGVFESLEYPWFSSWVINWEDEEGFECSDIMTDDASFCFKVKEKGYKIYVDPECYIPHEKLVAL